jgi:hypothetical protein
MEFFPLYINYNLSSVPTLERNTTTTTMKLSLYLLGLIAFSKYIAAGIPQTQCQRNGDICTRNFEGTACECGGGHLVSLL